MHTVIEYSKTPEGRSMLLQSVPGIGDGYSFLIGATGYDPVAGITLSGFERGLSIAAALPFVPGMAGLVGRAGDDLARAGLRYGDELSGSAGLARAGEHYGMGPSRYIDEAGGGGRLADLPIGIRGRQASHLGPRAQVPTTTVYRVEGSVNRRLTIANDGSVSLGGDKVLFLNFGDLGRAQAFLERRLSQGMQGAVIKSFDVPTSYVTGLRDRAITERLRSLYPSEPFVVDRAFRDQFGLPKEQFADLLKNIIPGSGRVH